MNNIMITGENLVYLFIQLQNELSLLSFNFGILKFVQFKYHVAIICLEKIIHKLKHSCAAKMYHGK